MRYSVLCSIAFATASTQAFAAGNDDDRLKIHVPAQWEEEKPVGANAQPEWTTERRFATTRAYVEEPYQVDFEQWWKNKINRDHTHYSLYQSEIGIGLPWRAQVDLYENIERTEEGTTRHSGNQVEYRQALAKWGEIPLNPTVYGEWKFNKFEADAYEFKLLLADQIYGGWHWGFNGFYEQKIGDNHDSEAGFAQGVSYTLSDKDLSLGAEVNVERSSYPGLKGVPNTEVLVGPSVQWRPTDRIHLDFVPLVGMNGDSPRLETYVVFGFDLYKPDRAESYAPVSVRSK